MTLLIKKVSSSEELEACLDIRHRVFVEGQKVPLQEEVDGKDADSCHYFVSLENMPIGTARVRFLGDYAKIERVALLDAYQGQGLGQALMNAIISDLSKQPNLTTAKLSAQSYAIPFYEKFGFSVCSEEYLDAGIPHKDMILSFE